MPAGKTYAWFTVAAGCFLALVLALGVSPWLAPPVVAFAVSTAIQGHRRGEERRARMERRRNSA